MKKRLFATLLALVMALGLTATAWADDPVTYVDKNGTVQTLTETYIEITETNKPTTWNDGWYVVKGDVRIKPPTPTQIDDNKYAAVKSSGNVNLILCDGATLTVTMEWNTGDRLSGIYSTGPLTIYGQSEGTGKLEVEAGGPVSEGIQNTDKLTINGGNVTATGNVTGISNYSSLTINGGKLTATGTGIYSAGIYEGTVNINSGTVIASGTKGFSDVNSDSMTLPTTDYWWRTAEDGAYTASAAAQYAPGEETYIEITTTAPVVTPPADEPEPEPTPEPEPVQPARPSGNKPTTPTETVSAPKTTDPGVLLTSALSVVSLLGMGYVGKKR